MINKDAVWLITGCSKGLGRALAQEVLRAGYRAVVTARRAADVDDVDGVVAEHGEAALAVALDVTRPDQVEAAVDAAAARFGGVDVLVNNAGYSYFAAIEEDEDADVRAMFETNVFGPLTLIRAVLPGMRARGRGHVVNIGSVGGLVTYPAVGHYHMTKFAIEGLSGTLAKELAPFGLGCTVVAPGVFLTEFRGPASARQSAVRLPAYAATAGRARDAVLAGHGTQQGDPARGARAIIAAVEAEHPPLHLVLGGDALDQIRQAMTEMQRDLDGWEAVTRSTDLRESERA